MMPLMKQRCLQVYLYIQWQYLSRNSITGNLPIRCIRISVRMASYCTKRNEERQGWSTPALLYVILKGVSFMPASRWSHTNPWKTPGHPALRQLVCQAWAARACTPLPESQCDLQCMSWYGNVRAAGFDGRPPRPSAEVWQATDAGRDCR